MSIDAVMNLAKETLEVTTMLMGPLLGVAMIVGLIIGIFQAMTSINEQTLTFFPKMFAVLAVFLYLLPWMLQLLMSFTQRLVLSFSEYGT